MNNIIEVLEEFIQEFGVVEPGQPPDYKNYQRCLIRDARSAVIMLKEMDERITEAENNE